MRRIQELTKGSPFVAATAVGCVWIVLWLSLVPGKLDMLGLFISAAPIGVIIGATRVERWYDCLRKLPGSALCFFVVSCFYLALGLSMEDYGGDQAGMAIFMIPVFVIYALPLLLFFSFVGWISFGKRPLVRV